MRIRDVSQLFNSMDPSPFHEKDLDADAEEFLVSWVRELPMREPITLVIEIERAEDTTTVEATVERAIHHYFAYRARMTRREFAQLMWQGQISLAIGLLFLLACFAARGMIMGLGEGLVPSFLRESLIIAGWVAMWRPMQIYLYEWWPLRRREGVYRKMSRMPVRVRIGGPRPAPEPAAPGSAV
jgi:hypothetical protein